MAAPFANVAPTSKLVFEKSSFAHNKSTHELVLDTKYFTYNVSGFFDLVLWNFGSVGMS